MLDLLQSRAGEGGGGEQDPGWQLRGAAERDERLTGRHEQPAGRAGRHHTPAQVRTPEIHSYHFTYIRVNIT